MKKENEKIYEVAAKMFKSMAHPVRIEIIYYLKEGKLSVSDIKEKLNISQSMTSQHLAILKNMEVVDCEKKANVCYYFIRNKEVLKLLECVEHCAKDRLS